MDTPLLSTGELSNQDKLNAVSVQASSAYYTRLQTDMEHSKVRAHIRRLAEHLKVLHAISDGRNIVPLIGSGHESNNLEALTDWVARQYADIASMEFMQQRDHLAKQLRRDIDSTIDRY